MKQRPKKKKNQKQGINMIDKPLANLTKMRRE
jgi:hypothetical protein